MLTQFQVSALKDVLGLEASSAFGGGMHGCMHWDLSEQASEEPGDERREKGGPASCRMSICLSLLLARALQGLTYAAPWPRRLLGAPGV